MNEELVQQKSFPNQPLIPILARRFRLSQQHWPLAPDETLVEPNKWTFFDIGACFGQIIEHMSQKEIIQVKIHLGR